MTALHAGPAQEVRFHASPELFLSDARSRWVGMGLATVFLGVIGYLREPVAYILGGIVLVMLLGRMWGWRQLRSGRPYLTLNDEVLDVAAWHGTRRFHLSQYQTASLEYAGRSHIWLLRLVLTDEAFAARGIWIGSRRSSDTLIGLGALTDNDRTRLLRVVRVRLQRARRAVEVSSAQRTTPSRLRRKARRR